MIKVVGLGRSVQDLTKCGENEIGKSGCVVVKTAFMPTYTYFLENNIPHITLDNIYNESENFDDLNVKICDFLCSLEKEKSEICYCVGGSGLSDRSVETLIKMTNVSVCTGVDFADNLLSQAVSEGVFKGQILGKIAISAYDVLTGNFDWDREKTLIITEIDNAYIASDIKLFLLNNYGVNDKILLFDKGFLECEVESLPLRETFDYATCIIVPSVPLAKKDRFSFGDVVKIMRVLRSDDGCAWDKAQTHLSIRENVVEEAYELVEAINNDDIDNMIEECGDVLLQSLFHAQIAEDCGEFDLSEVLSGLGKKLISRHTHIFGEDKASNADEALVAWNEAKAKEKKYTSSTHKMRMQAEALPALMRSQKSQKIASKMGLEFFNLEDVVKKLYEELEEVLQATDDELEMECGDLLFAACNVVRWKGINAEIALQKSLAKFMARCETLEQKCKSEGIETTAMTEEQFEKFWNEIKASEKR